MFWEFIVILSSLSWLANGAPIATTSESPIKPVINQLQKGDTNVIVSIKNAYITLPESAFDKKYLDKWLSQALTSYMEGNQEIPVFFNQHLNTKLSESASGVVASANDEVDLDNKGNLEFSSDVDLDSVTKTTEAAKPGKEEI